MAGAQGITGIAEAGTARGAPDMDVSRLRSFSGYMDGCRRTWKVYLPRACETGGPYPLVVSLHGGDYHTMPQRSAWHLLAEREGVIILYPESLVDGVAWNAWGKLTAEDGRADDAAFLDALLDHVLERYPVDPGRVYLHGQSMGDMMATYYAFLHPERLAGVAPFSGPTKTRWFMRPDGGMELRPAGPLPCLRLHGEEDNFVLTGLDPEQAKTAKRQCHIEVNNRLWREANGCGELPLITTTPSRTIERYRGRDGNDLIFYSTKDGVHAPPADFVEDIWRNLICCYRRTGGQIRRMEYGGAWRADEGAAAVYCGSRDAYVDHRLVHGGLPILPPERTGDGTLMVDLRQLPLLLPRLVTEVDAAAEHPRLSLRQGELILYPQSGLALKGGRFAALSGMERREGTLLLPFNAAMGLLDLYAESGYGAGYAVGHPFSMTWDLAYTIGTVLGQCCQPSNAEVYAIEGDIYRKQREEKGFPQPRSHLEEVWQWCHTV